MRERGVSTSALAVGVGLSYQGIRKIARDETKEMEASTCAKLAKFLQIDAEWLRTGKGSMSHQLPVDKSAVQLPSPERWPFPEIDYNKLLSLKGEQARRMQSAMLGAAIGMDVDISSSRPEPGKRAA